MKKNILNKSIKTNKIGIQLQKIKYMYKYIYNTQFILKCRLQKKLCQSIHPILTNSNSFLICVISKQITFIISVYFFHINI